MSVQVEQITTDSRAYHRGPMGIASEADIRPAFCFTRFLTPLSHFLGTSSFFPTTDYKNINYIGETDNYF